MNAAGDLLLRWAEQFHLHLDTSFFARIEDYEHLLQLWGRRTNLISAGDLPRFREHHVADSLVAASLCVGARSVVDVGSGAGLPGLVIAISLPEVQVTLLESRARRVSFLLEATRVLELENVSVVEARAEHAAQRAEHRLRYGAATLRAVAPPAASLTVALPLVRPAGTTVIMCGPQETAPENRGGSFDTLDYTLPDGTARRILIHRKAPAGGGCFT